MRIVVTGAGGFIGRALCSRLAGQGHEILALDNDFRGALSSISEHENITTRRCDVLDAAEVTRAFAGAAIRCGVTDPGSNQRDRGFLPHPREGAGGRHHRHAQRAQGDAGARHRPLLPGVVVGSVREPAAIPTPETVRLKRLRRLQSALPVQRQQDRR